MERLLEKEMQLQCTGLVGCCNMENMLCAERSIFPNLPITVCLSDERPRTKKGNAIRTEEKDMQSFALDDGTSQRELW